MTKLIYANLYRLKKSKCFWILLSLMFLIGIYLYINYNGWMGSGLLNCTGCENQTVFLEYISGVWFFLPIFICSFVGTEYSDGILKNKLISGHKRTNIYMANLLTCIIVDLLFCLSFIISVSVMEITMVNDIQIPLNKFGLLVLDSILLSFVFASIFNLLSMIISNKTASSIWSFIVVIWSMIIESTLRQKLDESVGAVARFYQILVDALPYNHLTQIIRLTDRAGTLCIVSICLLIIINVYGILYFKNKEIN